MGRNFDLVLTAENSYKAVTLLNSMNVTHLICDYWLGHNEPQGLELISVWRKKYPTIRRAILYTGTDLSDITLPLSVDRILSKTELPSLLIDAITD
jgi:DNA-binding NarL/FixJ family response regulator